MTEETLPPSPDPSGEGGDGERDDDDGPVGIFPSWRWLYATVLVYAMLLLIALHVFTVAFDHGAP